MPKATVADRLDDILEAVAKIRRHTAGLDAQGYAENEIVTAAVERWLLIVSEATRHLPDDMKAAHPGVPWRNVADFGNVIRHAYDQVIDHRVWGVVVDHLPALETACRAMRDRLAP